MSLEAPINHGRTIFDPQTDIFLSKKLQKKEVLKKSAWVKQNLKYAIQTSSYTLKEFI